jgi:hypothetical protein
MNIARALGGQASHKFQVLQISAAQAPIEDHVSRVWRNQYTCIIPSPTTRTCLVPRRSLTPLYTPLFDNWESYWKFINGIPRPSVTRDCGFTIFDQPQPPSLNVSSPNAPHDHGSPAIEDLTSWLKPPWHRRPLPNPSLDVQQVCLSPDHPAQIHSPKFFLLRHQCESYNFKQRARYHGARARTPIVRWQGRKLERYHGFRDLKGQLPLVWNTPCGAGLGALETEQKLTLYTGPFRIYRAPGSVAFLNCQNALRPIMAKSQCWVVDDDSSKFVLQIKPPQYWRIEVPNKTPEDKRRTEELKEVLGKVLLFEKTPCPFRRSFVVELPEPPKTPIRKKPWKPVERPKVETELRDSEIESVQDVAPPYTTRRFSTPSMISEEVTEDLVPLDTQDPVDIKQSSSTVSEIERGEDFPETKELFPYPQLQGETGPENDGIVEQPPIATAFASSSLAPILEPSLLEEESVFADFTGLDEDDSYSDATDDTNITPKSRFQPTYQSTTFDPEKEARRQQPLQHCSKSITAPPVLSLVTSPPSKHRTSSPLRNSNIVESDSDFSSSVESFHSVQSWHSPLAPPSPPASGPPSPVTQYPYPHNNIALPKRAHHSRDDSELTVTPDTPRVWEVNSSSRAKSAPRSRSLSPPPKTPTLVNDTSDKSDDEQFEIVTPPATIRSTVRHRATTSSNSRRRELSPLPAAVNLFSPRRRRSRHLQTARHLPTAIVQKTCEILLSPPSHLLHLMLNIASKIAAGEWRGVMFGYGEGESVHWDFEDEYGDEGWTEDDYGISLSNTKAKTKKYTNVPGGSWEVD